ncbi:MAG: serine hydrolase domain-containing protein [Pseudomonadota bacterium]
MVLCLSLAFSSGLRAAPAAIGGSSLERFVDGIMSQAIASGDAVGASIAIVDSGRALLVKGYGAADVARSTPVQGRRTLFRIGGISKVLTWIAVLQLVENGNLDLDADLSTYLSDVPLSQDFSEPLTLRHVMTHTTGFDTSFARRWLSGPRQVGSLREELIRQAPARVDLPGTDNVYGDYGAALAGYIVTQVTGMPLEQYLQQQVLAPLAMDGTSLQQPLSDELAARLALGYEKTPIGMAPRGFAVASLAPAQAGSATALDMARLMAELLNPSGTGVLAATSKRQLLQAAYLPHPGAGAMTLGLFEDSRHTQRMVFLRGDTGLFHSALLLWPDLSLGVFVAVNAQSGAGLVDGLTKTLQQHWGFAPPDFRLPALEPVNYAPQIAGTYVTTRRNHLGAGKILALLNTLTVEVHADEGELRVRQSFPLQHWFSRQYQAYQRTDLNAYRRVDGGDVLIFKTDAPARIYLSQFPGEAFAPAGPLYVLIYNLGFLLLWGLLALSVLLRWPLSGFGSGRRQRGSGWASLLQAGAVLVSCWFLWRLLRIDTSAYGFVMAGLAPLQDYLWLPLIVTALVTLQVLGIYRVLLNGIWSGGQRAHYVLMLLGNILLVWWFWFWQLVPAQALEFLRVPSGLF